MTTRAEVEEVIKRWGITDRRSLPPLLRGIEDALPLSRHQFNLAFALEMHHRGGKVTPIYDESGTLTGWKGIRLKRPSR